MPEAIRKFIEDIGLDQNDIVVPIDILYAENRKLLHEKSRQAKFKQVETGRGNMEIIMPDGSVVQGSTILSPKKEEVIHFIGFGYCKFGKKSKGKIVFYFAHK